MSILKSTLIGKSGKLIASKPKTSDIQHQLLESGLITAILEFSKSLQNQDIQSISYHDRTTSFIEFEDFFLVVEIDSEVSEDQKREILTNLQSSASFLLKKRSEDGLSLGEGELILEEVMNSTGRKIIEDSNNKFLDFTIGELSIKHRKTGHEIIKQYNCDECVSQIAAAIDRGLKLIDFKLHNEIYSIFIPSKSNNASFYFIIQYENKISNIYALKVPYSETENLFQLTPILNRKLKTDFPKTKKDLSIFTKSMLKLYRENTLEKKTFDPEFFSLSFLDKNIKNIEKAIFPLIVGDPLIIIGDRPSTKITLNSLLIFTQHLNVDIIEWLTTENEIATNITGMSAETYEKLVSQGKISDSITTINLNDHKVRGKSSSSFIKKIFDKIKNKSPVIAYAFIGNELEKIAKDAIGLNELVLLDKGRALMRLNDIIEEIKNPSKFKKILALAKKRNPWIEEYFEYLKSEKDSGKNYINLF